MACVFRLEWVVLLVALVAFFSRRAACLWGWLARGGAVSLCGSVRVRWCEFRVALLHGRVVVVCDLAVGGQRGAGSSEGRRVWAFGGVVLCGGVVCWVALGDTGIALGLSLASLTFARFLSLFWTSSTLGPECAEAAAELSASSSPSAPGSAGSAVWDGGGGRA